MKHLKIINYAVNGLGSGHITRLLAINKSIYKIAQSVGVNTEQIFITTSEADNIVYREGFASFKIPSKNIVSESGINPKTYRAIARHWIWNCVSLFNPDIFIVDTFPNGSFNELYDILELSFKKVLIYRARKDYNKILLDNSLNGYNQIIATLENEEDNIFQDTKFEHKVTTVGSIIQKDKDELFESDIAKFKLGIPINKKCCLILAGGGGDSFNEEFFSALIPKLEIYKDIHFIVAAGSLYRGDETFGNNSTWFYREGIMNYFNAFDFAISAGGYNSVNELIYSNLPTLFYHQLRKFDDQQARIERLYDKGFCLFSNDFNIEILLQKFDELRVCSTCIKEKLIDYNLKNYTLNCAAEILKDKINDRDIERGTELTSGEFYYSLLKNKIKKQHICKVLFTLDYLYHLNKKNITFFKTDTNYKVEEIEVIQSCTTRFLLYLQKEKLEFSLGLKLLKFQIMNLELSANNAIDEVIKIFDNWLHHFSDIKYELDLLVNSNKI